MVHGLRTFSRVAGEGPDVVLVHGAGVSSEYWRPAQRALAERGPFRVHALDLPGFGRSQDPDWPPELPRLAKHLHAWLEQVVPGRCHLVGQSLGCEITLCAAVEEPERFERLALAGPAGLPWLRSVAGQIVRAGLDAPFEKPSLYPAILPAYWRCGPRRLVRLLKEQKRCDVEKLLHEVSHPTLVLRGEKDMVVSRKRVETLARALPHGEAATMPGAHGSHFTHAEDFARIVAPFLAR